MNVIIMGPAHPLRGGLASFNHRLTEQFISEGHQCSLVSFSLQYPSILFPGKTQYSDEPPPENLHIRSLINSVNPLNWLAAGRKLRKERPDLIIVRFWLPFMGPALGTVLRQVKRNKHTRVVCIIDNVIPHEKRPGDKPFTKYFLKACDAFITMSEKVLADLRAFEPAKPARLVLHPLFDNLGQPLLKEEARQRLNLPVNERIILFFGFIRHYKGLDILLKAMADERVRKEGVKLLVAGEFYEDEKPYLASIKENGLEEAVILRTSFIPDSEVRLYLSAADCVVQPYRNATQSGVSPLAYYFEKPMIVTNVGGLPELVPHEKTGLIAEPEPAAIAGAIIRFYQLGEKHFIPHLRNEKQKYAWNNLTMAIREIAGTAAQ